MTTETIYQPVRKPTLMDRASDFYWSNQDRIDAALFLGVVVFTVILVVAVA